MANEGYIMIKKGGETKRSTIRDWFGPLDKGAAKPSFCYPKRKENLTEEVRKLEKAVENGYVLKDKEPELRMKLRQKKNRLDQLNAQESDAKKLFNTNKDAFMKRREQLAEEIAGSIPTRDAEKKRRINPYTTLKQEKQGGLETKKREFIILSRLAGEESNIGFLQKDK